MFGQFDFEPMWTRTSLKESYDVVIIGAGVHGLATFSAESRGEMNRHWKVCASGMETGCFAMWRDW